jgi:hypothetical protein
MLTSFVLVLLFLPVSSWRPLYSLRVGSVGFSGGVSIANGSLEAPLKKPLGDSSGLIFVWIIVRRLTFCWYALCDIVDLGI